MKSKKIAIIITSLLIFSAINLGIALSYIISAPKVLECPRHIKVIDLPEEIELIKKTTKIIGYIQNDTLYIQFNR